MYNSVLSGDAVEAIAYVLYLEDWLGNDESLSEIDDNLLRNLDKKWKEEWLPYRNAAHFGDCTKFPATCMRCVLDDLFFNARRILGCAHEIKCHCGMEQ